MCKKKKLDLSDELTENIREIGIITFEKIANCLWEDVPYIIKVGKILYLYCTWFIKKFFGISSLNSLKELSLILPLKQNSQQK